MDHQVAPRALTKSASPRLLSTPAVYIHALAAAFWIGSLWPLWVLLRRAALAEAERIVRRFSRIAVASVLLLIIAGAALSVVQDEAPRALVTTAYGRILLVKLGLVVLLLGLAVLNRKVLTPRLAGGSVRALRSSILGGNAYGIAGSQRCSGSEPLAAKMLARKVQKIHAHAVILVPRRHQFVEAGGECTVSSEHEREAKCLTVSEPGILVNMKHFDR